MYKTTKKDFEEFKKECWFWINYFGLQSYEWDIRHETPSTKDARADYEVLYKPRYVCVRLNIFWSVNKSKNEIKVCAFHEICHIMLLGLSEMAYNFYSDGRVEIEEHKIISILENTLFKEKRK